MLCILRFGVILYLLGGVKYDRFFLGGLSGKFAPQHVR
jgi:hypothetical protein